MSLRVGRLITIILNGDIRVGRIRCCDPDASHDGRYLDVRGQRIDLDQLTEENEDTTWARGWDSEAAKALRAAHALKP